MVPSAIIQRLVFVTANANLLGLRDLGGGVQVCEYCDTGQQAQSNQGEEDAQHPFQYTVLAFSCVLFLPVRARWLLEALWLAWRERLSWGVWGPSCAEWPALLCAVRVASERGHCLPNVHDEYKKPWCPP